MGLLAPLYIAGLAAIALPILFHLIRRTPEGRQAFSSLMFLQPSPPRLTKRSRLTNILLLILRACALALLALAFARPFFAGANDATVSESRGRRLAVLVDTSASMRRRDLWTQATRHVEKVLGELTAADEVSLLLFDRQVRPAMTFAEWNQLELSRRPEVLKQRLAQAAPTWAATNLGEAISAAADLLTENEGARAPGAPAEKLNRQLVLVSDMQEGGHVEAMQGRPWPEGVQLEVRPVSLKQATNASVQYVKQAPPDGTEKPDNRLRVRVANAQDSTKEQFELVWVDDKGPVAGVQPQKVYVPPGRSTIVRVAWPTAGQKVDRLVLQGDEADFDNTLYVVPPREDAVRVAYVGDDGADDVKGLLYYLQSASGATPQRKVEVVARRADQKLAEADLVGARLAVVDGTPAEDQVAILRRYAEGGGDVLAVMKDAGAAKAVGRLMGVADLKAEEAKGDFALIARVETGHPLFAPFADPRFGDFTKIHFWKHRKVKPEDAGGARVLAWFDSRDPFLLERSVGKGRVLVMTSGWQPADSQLALSTKFVPLMEGLLRRRDGFVVDAQYAVGEPVALPQGAPDAGVRAVVGPDGKRVELAANATTFDGSDRPGVYRLVTKGEEVPLAVNLAADESRTTPVPVEELEQFGAKMGFKPVSDELVTRQRQMRVAEWENRQKLWRWLIVGVLGLLAAETALAGVLARRNSRQQQATT
jgi:hypothetical protein